MNTVCHVVSKTVCVGVVLLIATSAQAQNLFVANAGSYPNFSGNIVEITPDGTQSTFASGFYSPAGLAFNSAGNLFVANTGDLNITEITPDGTQSIYATTVSKLPTPLAIQPFLVSGLCQ
jgi:DNA-binding beta-propeller fold protein YncE